MAAILVGVIFILVALIFLAFQWLSFSAGKKTLSWPSTHGNITQSTLLTTARFNQRPNNSVSQFRTAGVTIGSTTTTLNTMYSANIRYSYSVAGQKYEGSRVSVADTQSNTRAKYEQLVAQYPQDAAVSVYYNPEHPIDSVLQPGASVSAAILIFCFIFLGVGIALLF